MSEARIPTSYVTVARVLRPRGNRGEIAAEDFSDRPGRFSSLKQVYLCGTGRPRERILLERAWYHGGRLILKFQGIDSIPQAEALRGCEVQIPESELGAPPEDEFYFKDLLGCRVVDADSGRLIGEVEGILEPGETVIMQVRSGEREILIPFAREICVEIAPERKEILVRMPEGLEELNP